MSAAEGTRPYGGVSAADRVADRRERLLEAGLEVLSAEGWAGMTVRRVCAEAKLTERYFYESFPSRDDLLAAVFDRTASELAQVLLEAIAAAGDDEGEKARAAIGAFVDLLVDDPRRGRAMLIESVAAPTLRDRRAQAIDGFATLVADQAREFYGDGAVSPENLRLTSVALTGAVNETVVAWLEGRLDVAPERLVEHCAQLFVAAASVSSSEP